jgi:hypothetical protein
MQSDSADRRCMFCRINTRWHPKEYGGVLCFECIYLQHLLGITEDQYAEMVMEKRQPALSDTQRWMMTCIYKPVQ